LKDFEANKVATGKVEYVVKEKKEEEEWVKELRKMDPLALSPMEALNYLYELKKKMK
jgi:hypothetical protein